MTENETPSHAEEARSILGFLLRIAAMPEGEVEPVTGHRAGSPVSLGTVYRAHPSSTSTLPFIVAAGHLRDLGVITTEPAGRIEPATILALAVKEAS